MAHLATTNSGSSPGEAALFERVAIVGVGLIGGSLGLALCGRGQASPAGRHRLAGRVVGVGHARPSLDRALQRGAVDEATLRVAEGVEGADLVVLAVPVSRICPLGRAAAGHLAQGAQVVDVGSTKARVVATLEPLLAAAGARFVGCHPLAGSEQRSIEAARADLFEGAVTVVTPTDATDPAALEQAEALWRAVGSKVVRVSPAEHDALVALSSHLPHAAAALVAVTVASAARHGSPSGTASDLDRLADFVAGGFRDTTRVASSDPLLWRDILLDNRQCVAAALEVLAGRLEALRQGLLRGDGDAVADLLAQAKETRDALIR